MSCRANVNRITYRVVIYEFGEAEPIEIIGTGLSERKADRVQRGVLINLNQERFCVAVEEE